MHMDLFNGNAEKLLIKKRQEKLTTLVYHKNINSKWIDEFNLKGYQALCNQNKNLPILTLQKERINELSVNIKYLGDSENDFKKSFPTQLYQKTFELFSSEFFWKTVFDYGSNPKDFELEKLDPAEKSSNKKESWPDLAFSLKNDKKQINFFVECKSRLVQRLDVFISFLPKLNNYLKVMELYRNLLDKHYPSTKELLNPSIFIMYIKDDFKSIKAGDKTYRLPNFEINLKKGYCFVNDQFINDFCEDLEKVLDIICFVRVFHQEEMKLYLIKNDCDRVNALFPNCYSRPKEYDYTKLTLQAVIEKIDKHYFSPPSQFEFGILSISVSLPGADAMLLDRKFFLMKLSSQIEKFYKNNPNENFGKCLCILVCTTEYDWFKETYEKTGVADFKLKKNCLGLIICNETHHSKSAKMILQKIESQIGENIIKISTIDVIMNEILVAND